MRKPKMLQTALPFLSHIFCKQDGLFASKLTKILIQDASLSTFLKCLVIVTNLYFHSSINHRTDSQYLPTAAYSHVNNAPLCGC